VAPFRHAFLFPGAAARLAGLSTTFHPLHIAMDTRDRLPLVPWQDRSFLALINSNKRAGSIAPGLPWRQRWQAEVTYWALRTVDPLLRGRELYADRLAAIRYFARYDGFHLYGYGWEQPVHRANRATQTAVRRANRGEIAAGLRAKRAVLNRYRFAICFENTIFPGYLTEKLFDCLLAGCIPIYWGDPTVAVQIPPTCYIDYRQFGDLAELDRYLQQLGPDAAQRLSGRRRQFSGVRRVHTLSGRHLCSGIARCGQQQVGWRHCAHLSDSRSQRQHRRRRQPDLAA
jgi:hypothetical protein